MRLRTANTRRRRAERAAAEERAYLLWWRCAVRYAATGRKRGIVQSGYLRRVKAAQKRGEQGFYTVPAAWVTPVWLDEIARFETQLARLRAP